MRTAPCRSTPSSCAPSGSLHIACCPRVPQLWLTQYWLAQVNPCHNAAVSHGHQRCNWQRAACECRPAGGDEAPSSRMSAAVVSYEVAVVHASSATLLPPSALQQPAQPGSGRCQAEGGGGCQAAGSGADVADADASSGKEPSSSGGEQGSPAAAGVDSAGSAAAPGAPAAQTAGHTVAVRHIVTLKKGREWRFAAIWHNGGIAVWREDGAGC